MHRITLRKRTDDGHLIPAWAARGLFETRDFSLLGGSWTRTIKIRCDPQRGKVIPYYTGPDYEEEGRFTNVEVGEFCLSQGFRGILELGATDCCEPFSSNLHSGSSLFCNRSISEPECELLRYFWSYSAPAACKRVLLKLPIAVLLAAATTAKDMFKLNLEGLECHEGSDPSNIFALVSSLNPSIVDISPDSGGDLRS